MIAQDQATIFEDAIICAFSSRDDGTMRDASGRHGEEGVAHRKAFLADLGIEYDNTVYHVMTYYEGATYNSYALVDGRSVLRHETMGVQADALITSTPGIALMLPVADCNAVALYDPVRRVLASAHVGRHNTLTDLMSRVVSAMRHDFGCNPENIRAWLSPSIAKQSYAMQYFDQKDDQGWKPFVAVVNDKIHIDISGHTRAQLIEAGLLAEHIETSTVDTATDDNYFCHNRGDKDGRMAMVTMIKQGEPAA